MARTNLSLGNLYRAVSGSARPGAVSLSGLAGGGTNINLQSFSIDAVTASVLYTYIVEGTSESASFTFTSQGSRHQSKVAPVVANYSVSSSQFTTGSLTAGSGVSSFAFTAGTIAGSTYGTERTDTMVLKYADGYNINATNYNSNVNVTLILVDVYNTVNQPDFCLVFGTKVKLSDGTEINVEDINVGDEIKAWVPDGLPDENQDPESEGVDWTLYQLEELSGTPQNVTVKDLTFNFADGYYSINGGLIKATGTHPIYVWNSEIQKYKFKTIEELISGDKLIKYTEENGEEEIVVDTVDYIEEAVEIVTINVENSDVFISNNLISHNKGTKTQPMIPGNGLVMYLDPSKTASFAAGSLPATGTPSVDWLDLTGYGTGVRPGAQPPLSLANSNPSYNNGADRTTRYYSFDGGDLFYKDTTSNINGGITQFNTNTGTIHILIQPTTTLGTSTRHIFDYGGYYGLAIESTDNSTLNRVKFYGSSLGNSSQFTTSLSTTGLWYMISATFQPSGTVTVYVNGSSVGTFTAAAFSAPSSTNYLTIGANSARTSFWNGRIGPVLFYNVLQSATNISRVYNHFAQTYII